MHIFDCHQSNCDLTPTLDGRPCVSKMITIGTPRNSSVWGVGTTWGSRYWTSLEKNALQGLKSDFCITDKNCWSLKMNALKMLITAIGLPIYQHPLPQSKTFRRSCRHLTLNGLTGCQFRINAGPFPASGRSGLRIAAFNALLSVNHGRLRSAKE